MQVLGRFQDLQLVAIHTALCSPFHGIHRNTAKKKKGAWQYGDRYHEGAATLL